MRVFLVTALFFALGLSNARADTYYIDISGGTSVIEPSCVASVCAFAFETPLYTVPAGSTVNFGSVTLYPYEFDLQGWSSPYPSFSTYVGSLNYAFGPLPNTLLVLLSQKVAAEN